MSPDTNDDELTEEELEARKEKYERAGWGTEHIEEQLQALESEREAEERLVDLKMKIQEAEAKGLGDDPAVERLREQSTALQERLTDDDVDPRKQELETLQKQVDVMERRGWEQADKARERIETLQAELDGEDAETEALSESSSLTSGPSVSDIEATSVGGEPDRTVEVRDALEKWDIDTSGTALRQAIEERERRAETFDSAGWESLAAQVRSEIEVLEAAAEGRPEVDVSDAAVARDIRAAQQDRERAE